MSQIEEITYKYSQFIYVCDELDRISYAFNFETILRDIKYTGYVNETAYWRLEAIGVNLTKYLMRYKKISEIEASELLRLEYVTFQNLIDIMKFTIDNWTKK